MAQVELTHITKRFGETLVIDDCSLVAKDKEFLVLVGPSGCGKSTLLRIVAGLETPTTGDVTIGGRRVNDLPPKDRDIAMVFQSYALYPHMNVSRNMGFGLKMRGYSKDEIDRRVRDAAKILEIENLLPRKPAQLSGGQRQRVAMGRAIVRKPAVFLFDEPLSNLDARLRVQMRLEIKRLHERIQTTTIYVTHDQVEAMTLADRIAIMEGGVIQQLDTPGRVYDHPANRFVAAFIGSPPMNFIPATIKQHNGILAADAATFVLPLPKKAESTAGMLMDRKVFLGIRPEHLCLSPPVENAESIEVETDVVEPLGASTIVICKAGDHLLSATVSSDASIPFKQKFALYLSPEHIQLFDGESGFNLLQT